MDMISTIKGTLFEQLYPAGWDLERLCDAGGRYNL